MSSINQTEAYWASLSESNTPDSQPAMQEADEFNEGQSVLSNPTSRRTFLKLMGGSFALAGLSGCGSFRKPTQLIKPYAKQPEMLVPGKSTYYATAMQVGHDVTGLLVESHEGRPTKVEGNPSHPNSMGSASTFHQASILSLYDPDRLQHVLHNQSPSTRSSFTSWLRQRRIQFKSGKNLSILVDSFYSSPTATRLLAQLKSLYPTASLYSYNPLHSSTSDEGLKSLTQQSLVQSYNIEKADVIVSFGSDFLVSGTGSLRHAKGFSTRRDPLSKKGLNRLYAIESQFSLTGSMADHRIRVRQSNIEGALWLLANRLLSQLDGPIPGAIEAFIKQGAKRAKGVLTNDIINAITSDLLSHKGRSLLVAGDQLPASVHGLLYFLNRLLGNAGKTVVYRQRPKTHQHYASLESLTKNLQLGKVDTLVILGGNPVYNAPGNTPFKEALKKAAHTVYLSAYANETAEQCEWVVPQSHYLESWGDLESSEGVVSIVQPLIQPLYPDSISPIDLLALLSGSHKGAYTQVRHTLRRYTKGSVGTAWKKWLHTGIVRQKTRSISSLPYSTKGLSSLLNKRLLSYNTGHHDLSHHDIELCITSDYSVFDGQFANNAWLQEAPDPVTKLTWDNAALMSPVTANKLSVKTEDVISITVEGHTIRVPVVVSPGHADYSVSIAMGYGQEKSGRIGQHAGFSVFPLMQSHSRFVQSSVMITKTDQTYVLATTQKHHSLEGRPLYRESTEDTYKNNPMIFKNMGTEHPPLTSVWDEKKYDTGNQWGMTIDLSKCTGCNACLVACQSENNIPIVGKEEVLNGREMHWIRLDRYYKGTESDPRMVHQAVPCMHCELAPCEQVCPVAATVHDDEGLNVMTYNRCIGTRYCSNNCAYKVRRFNFFDWEQRNPQAIKKDRQHFFDYFKSYEAVAEMQHNPDVTVRMRGIMEKCTYCIQRINEGKSLAKNEDRALKDGDIITACQQTCPSEAIVFGNILDKKSAVAKRRKEKRVYTLLEELNAKPRTLYLGRLNNPHPSLVSVPNVKEADDEHHS